jgi:hypothetical protein
MSKIHNHAKDAAEFTSCETAGGEFAGNDNLQEIVDLAARHTNPNFTGTMNIDTINISAGGVVTGGTFTFNNNVQVTFHDDINQDAGIANFSGDGFAIQAGQDCNIDADATVFNGISVDFSGVTVTGLPIDAVSTSGTTATGGWHIDGDTGLITQWGETASLGANGSQTVTLDKVMTDTKYNIVATMMKSTQSEQGGTAVATSTTQIKIQASHDSGSYPFRWMVTGY